MFFFFKFISQSRKFVLNYLLGILIFNLKANRYVVAKDVVIIYGMMMCYFNIICWYGSVNQAERRLLPVLSYACEFLMIISSLESISSFDDF